MVDLLKKFCLKILKNIGELIAKYLAQLIIAVTISVFSYFGWLFRNLLLQQYTLTMPIYMWVLVCLFIPLLCFIIYHYTLKICKRLKRLNDPKDIQHAIEEWFNHASIYFPVEIDSVYYFNNVDKELNIKRGSSRKFLPLIALKHKYYLHKGKDTFILKFLNDHEKKIFADYLKGSVFSKLDELKNETNIDCREIAEAIEWPVEAIEELILLRYNNKYDIQFNKHKAIIKIKQKN